MFKPYVIGLARARRISVAFRKNSERTKMKIRVKDFRPFINTPLEGATAKDSNMRKIFIGQTPEFKGHYVIVGQMRTDMLKVFKKIEPRINPQFEEKTQKKVDKVKELLEKHKFTPEQQKAIEEAFMSQALITSSSFP